MKRFDFFFLCSLIIFSCCSSLAYSQDETEEKPSRRRGGGIVGGGGGVSPAWFFLNASKLNAELAALDFPVLPKDGMFMFGGHGYGYVLFVPNLRIGGMGAGGSIEATTVQNGVFRSTELTAAYGGVTIEYVIPLHRFHIAIGGLLGGGSFELTMIQTPDRAKSWEELFLQTGQRHSMENNYFAWQPWITLEYDITPFIEVAITGGYFGTSGSTWTIDKHFDLTHVPPLNFPGPFIRAGLTFGLFIGE